VVREPAVEPPPSRVDCIPRRYTEGPGRHAKSCRDAPMALSASKHTGEGQMRARCGRGNSRGSRTGGLWKRWIALSGLALVEIGTPQRASATLLWYAGDVSGIAAADVQYPGGGQFLYDDFVLGSASTVGGFFGNYWLGSQASFTNQATWELRSGAGP